MNRRREQTPCEQTPCTTDRRVQILSRRPSHPTPSHPIPSRQILSRTFGLCAPLDSELDANRLAAWLLNVWDTLAMGNFP